MFATRLPGVQLPLVTLLVGEKLCSVNNVNNCSNGLQRFCRQPPVLDRSLRGSLPVQLLRPHKDSDHTGVIAVIH